jgi:hypothetical protein
MLIQTIPPTVVAASGGSPDAASSLASYVHALCTCRAAEQRQRYAEWEVHHLPLSIQLPLLSSLSLLHSLYHRADGGA